MSPLVQRVVAAFGAHSYGQAINILTQLASLPLFLTVWDPATYGGWLILTAMPAYLTMSDGGLVTAAANEISIAYTKNDWTLTNRVFQSTFAFVSIVCASILAVAWIAIFCFDIPGIESQDKRIALICLATGILIAQFNGLAETIFRAAGNHALGIFLGNTARLIEWSGWIIGLFIFKTFAGVAATGLAFRAAGFLITLALSIRLKSGIHWGFAFARKQQIRALISPAASFMSFTLSNALSIQGVTLLVGHLLGPTSVTIFNTYRTISRVALLITSTLGNSVWAEFSRLYANGGMELVKPLFQRASRISIGASIGLSAILMFTSPILLKYWSRNHIEFTPVLMALMLGYAAVAGTWNVARVFLMAINSHQNLSRIALLGACGTLTICYVLGSHFDLNGIATGLVIVESLMAFICIRAAMQKLGSQSLK